MTEETQNHKKMNTEDIGGTKPITNVDSIIFGGLESLWCSLPRSLKRMVY
jgi:hypothetical protein